MSHGILLGIGGPGHENTSKWRMPKWELPVQSIGCRTVCSVRMRETRAPFKSKPCCRFLLECRVPGADKRQEHADSRKRAKREQSPFVKTRCPSHGRVGARHGARSWERKLTYEGHLESQRTRGIVSLPERCNLFD